MCVGDSFLHRLPLIRMYYFIAVAVHAHRRDFYLIEQRTKVRSSQRGNRKQKRFERSARKVTIHHLREARVRTNDTGVIILHPGTEWTHHIKEEESRRTITGKFQQRGKR